MKPSHIAVVFLCSVELLAGSLFAQPTEDRLQQMEKRMAAMEAELQQYRAAEQANQASLKAVQDDAAARSTTVSSARTGYSNGFFIADQNNRFQLKVNALLLGRYLYNHNESDTGDNGEAGFQMRRAEVYLNGNVINPKVFYQMSGGFSSATGNFGIISAYGGYQFDKHWDARAGVMKGPFMIEELTPAGRQQTSERSYVNSYFTVGITEGMQVQYTGESARVATMFHNGSNTVDTEFNADHTDFAIASRAEWKLAGDWSQFTDFEGWSDAKTAIKLAAAVDYEAGETGDAQDIGNIVKYVLDLTVKENGWSVFLAGVGKHTDSTVATPTLDQYGLLAQGGVFLIPNRFEAFTRYEQVYFDGLYNSSTPAIDNHVNMITVGGNWFFMAHNAKFTLEAIYVFDAVPVSTPSAGILESDGSQTVFRATFTLFL